ncbi:uncharacterized protein LOC132565102 [Ylistrum balloti]|uniref:uncharacterized protein LOC132565102 n=1 Tax=Ylistrum balloti TaxID=509963 RepID=UPI002905A614|nr:uncharacterized protein LOC132565102 [Ylistrum balloti]
MVIEQGVVGPQGRQPQMEVNNKKQNETVNRKCVQGVILNLQRSYDVEIVQASLLELQVLAKKNEGHRYLDNKEVHQSIMTAISHLGFNKDIQKFGCEVLADLVERITDLSRTFSQSSTLG